MLPRTLTRMAVGGAASVAVLMPVAACSSNDSGPQSPSPRPTTAPPASSASSTPSPSAAAYKDGTYTVRGVYGGAPSYMTITLTLTDDTITAVKVGLMPDNNETSRGYQERFAAAVPDEVIGKSIDDLTVGKLAGASGCADGFNDALTKIRQQAANQ